MKTQSKDMFTIESNIPLPKHRGEFLNKAINTLTAMKPNNSFFVQGPTPNVRWSLYNAAKLAKVKISIQKSTQGSIEGFRVWRVRWRGNLFGFLLDLPRELFHAIITMKYSIRNRYTGLTHTGMTRGEVENYFSSRIFGDYSFRCHADGYTYTLSGPDGNINTKATLSELCDMYEYSLLPHRLALRSWVQMQPGRAKVTSVVGWSINMRTYVRREVSPIIEKLAK